MKRFSRHIVAALVLAVVLFASCRKDGARVISRGKLAKIYAEMLVTDQWITSTPGVRIIADTSLVYEPILEKYGYTSEDYARSVEVYLDDPERFSRILRTSSDILDKRLKELKRLKREMEAEEENRIEIEIDFDISEFFPYMKSEPYVHYYDSLAVEADSATLVYRIVPVERADTLYDCLRMIIRDSMTVNLADSLSVSDSLKPSAGRPALKTDSVAVRLGLPAADTDTVRIMQKGRGRPSRPRRGLQHFRAGTDTLSNNVTTFR